MNILIKN